MRNEICRKASNDPSRPLELRTFYSYWPYLARMNRTLAYHVCKTNMYKALANKVNLNKFPQLRRLMPSWRYRRFIWAEEILRIWVKSLFHCWRFLKRYDYHYFLAQYRPYLIWVSIGRWILAVFHPIRWYSGPGKFGLLCIDCLSSTGCNERCAGGQRISGSQCVLRVLDTLQTEGINASRWARALQST